ncbi:MAG: redoxin domain-containing protein [Bacteroidota bacterium]
MVLTKPGEKAPNLVVQTLYHGTWELYKQKPKHFTLIVFFRGYHCSTCMEYIHDLGSKVSALKKLGVEVITLSCDGKERAEMTAEEWHLGDLPLGYNLSVQQAREWGLYVSKAIRPFENDVFSEPGLFLVRRDHSLYLAQVQSHPFARPDLSQFLKDIEYILERNYPARGEM